jgi:hypothetical protein
MASRHTKTFLNIHPYVWSNRLAITSLGPWAGSLPSSGKGRRSPSHNCSRFRNK